MDINDQTSPEAIEKHRLNAETGRINWVELQRFFAAGRLVHIDNELDLVDVAYQFSIDNHQQTESWLSAGSVRRVDDDQARAFHEQQTEFWAIVVKPWVLIQMIEPGD